MLKKLFKSGLFFIAVVLFAACSETDPIGPQTLQNEPVLQTNTSAANARMGVETANGWYEGEEIYYIDHGIEEGVTERGENDIYLIGGNRKYQAQVVEIIPGEAGYSPHWNVNLVITAEGVTLDAILASPYVSAHYPEALFDDVGDILGAQTEGLVTIVKLGVVVNCPIISEQGADAPGNTPLSENFPPFPDTF